MFARAAIVFARHQLKQLAACTCSNCIRTQNFATPLLAGPLGTVITVSHQILPVYYVMRLHIRDSWGSWASARTCFEPWALEARGVRGPQNGHVSNSY